MTVWAPELRDRVVDALVAMLVLLRPPRGGERERVVELLLEDLAGQDGEAVLSAIAEWRRTQDFWPTPRELLALVAEQARPRVVALPGGREDFGARMARLGLCRLVVLADAGCLAELLRAHGEGRLEDEQLVRRYRAAERGAA